ncbi:hypothetical protein [Dyadobacter sp. CY326]|uniref:hypothetical protein n=1 Tax=Dyadobacter sp. CY326 TaxID=2907300 RepID=UPI001F3ED256|nr:hypothetical protein [Dyadobacter sp. CY326]MCE7065677.1 hypothetical protein [Dyadobacter sp. CY326]
MKNKIWKFIPALTLIFSLPPSVALPKENLDGFFVSPLVLNGRSVSPAELATARGGKLSLVKGNPGNNKISKVPFLIYLTRNGKIVNGNAYAHNNPVVESDIYELLKPAKAGDQMTIEPVNKSDQIERRIITVQSSQLTPQFIWFRFNKKNDGC